MPDPFLSTAHQQLWPSIHRLEARLLALEKSALTQTLGDKRYALKGTGTGTPADLIDPDQTSVSSPAGIGGNADTLDGFDSLFFRDASNLNAGTLPDARFPATLPAASGVNLTALNASNLASGTVPDGRFPATLPVASGVNLTNLNASNLASGTVPDGRFPATLPVASGVNLTNLNAANLASGTVPTARLGSGAASSTTFLRGDQTWASVGIKSIQNGSTTIPSADLSASTTITAVTTAKSYIHLRSYSTETDGRRLWVELTNSTTVTANKNFTGAAQDVHWTVVEFS